MCSRSYWAIIRWLLVDEMIRSSGRETFGAVVEARRVGGVHLGRHETAGAFHLLSRDRKQ